MPHNIRTQEKEEYPMAQIIYLLCKIINNASKPQLNKKKKKKKKKSSVFLSFRKQKISRCSLTQSVV